MLTGGCRGARQHEWHLGKNNMIVVLQNSEPIEKHSLLTVALEDEGGGGGGEE